MIQRGRSCFSGTPDRLAYVELLATSAAHHECSVHAYALMSNHVHLLLTVPRADSGTLLARSLSQSHESPELRPVHARRYLLACMRYIELNPVRAQMVRRPQDYRWSSYRANALGREDALVTPHPLYYALGRSPEERRRAYARFVEHNRFGSALP